MANDLKNLMWWPEEGKAMADKVMARARSITASQQWRRDNEEMYLRLYSEDEWRGVYGLDKRRSTTIRGKERKNRLSINVVRNISNAATSMLVRARPYVSFQTDGADFDLLRKSRKRERFCQAHFIKEKIHQLSQSRVRNGVIFGNGGTWVYRQDGQIRYENILPGQMLIDEQEGMAGDPPCMYREKTVDKLRLAEMYPEHREAIMKASSAGNAMNGGGEDGAQCSVVYAWHFRSTYGQDSHDGVEALCIDGATLYKRPYRWRKFPGTFFRWCENPFGWHGTGIPAELVGKQYEINTLLRMIRESTYYGGNIKIMAPKGSNITISQISNSLKIPVIEHAGAAPQFVVNDVASPQIFSHLQFLIQSSYQDTGISQLDAQSQTPAATMSGRARLVHQNNESLRFKDAVERYEGGYPELAEATLQAATDELEENGNQHVIFRGREHLEEISLEDIKLQDDEDIDIQAWSSSQLAQSPGARMEQVDFLVQNKYLPKNRGLVMMDLGNDFKAEMDLANAPANLIDERLERIVMDGEAHPPVPYMDLDYALERSQLEIQRCEMRKGVPEERIDMLREFREQVIDLKLKAKAGAAPAPQDMTGGAIPLPGANAAPPLPPQGTAPMIPPQQEMLAA